MSLGFLFPPRKVIWATQNLLTHFQMSLLRLTQGEEIERKDICPKFTHTKMRVERNPNCLNSELFPWETVYAHLSVYMSG